MMYLKVENENQIILLESLAKKIWSDYFGPMFEAEILEYIIDKVQSKQAIKNQIKEGLLYYFIQIETSPVGYFSYQISENKEEVFLSKLYIVSTERGKGHGRQVIKYIEEICKDKKIPILSLTVFYKNSSAINAYEKMGFKNIGCVNRDIGNGIVINDYKMEKSV